MKKFYREHRVFLILMVIVVVCVITSVILLLQYFYFGDSDKAPKRSCPDVSASRQKDITDDLKKETIVVDANLTISDKSNLIFITISFNEDATLVEAQSIALITLEGFNEEEIGCYDYQFTIDAPQSDTGDGFHLMGARNASGTNIHWNNNKEIEPAGE